jgi:hypothetical protein
MQIAPCPIHRTAAPAPASAVVENNGERYHLSSKTSGTILVATNNGACDIMFLAVLKIKGQNLHMLKQN